MISDRTRGADGERLATRFLERRGYRILATNYRTRLGEIDLIAEDGSTLVFIEVKARADASFGGPAVAITLSKQARISRIARQYLAARGLGHRSCRFDAVLILGDDPKTQRIELVAGAFDVPPDSRV